MSENQLRKMITKAKAAREEMMKSMINSGPILQRIKASLERAQKDFNEHLKMSPEMSNLMQKFSEEVRKAGVASEEIILKYQKLIIEETTREKQNASI